MLTDGASGSQALPGVSVDSEAASFSAVTLGPKRLTARYVWRVEDGALLAGLEDSLRTDLVGALADKMDAEILQGDGMGARVSFCHPVSKGWGV